MGKDKTSKIQIVLICMAIVLVQVAIYLWLPTWQTILITLAVNLIGLAFILQLFEKGEESK